MKGIVSTLPLSTFRRRNFPPWEMMMDLPSAVHAIPGRIGLLREFLRFGLSSICSSIRRSCLHRRPKCRSRTEHVTLIRLRAIRNTPAEGDESAVG